MIQVEPEPFTNALLLLEAWSPYAEGCVVVDQLPAVLDHHAIGREIISNRQIPSIAEDRTGARNQNAIATDGGKYAVADVTEAAIDYLAAIADHQTVVGAAIARIQVTVTPDRTAIGHEHEVIAVPVARPQFTHAVDQYATALNKQHIANETDIVIARPITAHTADDVGLEVAGVLCVGAAGAEKSSCDKSQD